MIDKAKVVKAINHRLSLTTAGQQKFDEREHEAPVFHALVGSLVDAINSELADIRRELLS